MGACRSLNPSFPPLPPLDNPSRATLTRIPIHLAVVIEVGTPPIPAQTPLVEIFFWGGHSIHSMSRVQEAVADFLGNIFNNV